MHGDPTDTEAHELVSIQEALARLQRSWGWTPPTPEDLAEALATRRALGPEYVDCDCLGEGGHGDRLGAVLEWDDDHHTPLTMVMVDDQPVYTWAWICTCPDGRRFREWLAQQRVLAAEQLRQKRVRRLLGASGIDALYAGFTIESWVWAVRQRLEAEGRDIIGDPLFVTVRGIAGSVQIWNEGIQAGSEQTILLLGGPYGTGKSGLATAVVSVWVDALKTALFRSASGIAAELRAAPYRAPDDDPEARTWDRVLAAYQDADLLVIDDLGGESMTTGTGDTVREVVFSIIDGRMLAKRPTIVTTNRTREQIADRYGERVADRLDSRYALRLWLDGPNLRRPRAES